MLYRRPVCLFVTACLALLALPLSLSLAPRPADAMALPPRPTVVPTQSPTAWPTILPPASPTAHVVPTSTPLTIATATQVVATAIPRPQVGAIAVQVVNPPPGAWVGVQWQDTLGGWHDVESWPGELKESWAVRWVLPKNFGEGPFRWTVYEKQGGQLWACSSPFYFPSSLGEWVWLEVTPVTPTATPTAKATAVPAKKAAPTKKSP